MVEPWSMKYDLFKKKIVWFLYQKSLLWNAIDLNIRKKIIKQGKYGFDTPIKQRLGEYNSINNKGDWAPWVLKVVRGI